MKLSKQFFTVIASAAITISVQAQSWNQQGPDIDGEAAGDESGCSVSMPDINTVAVGAHYNNGSGNGAGHVRIYEWNGSAWMQKGADINGEAADDYSGFSVSMPDYNTVAIGATDNGGSGFFAGHVRIYAWNGSAWAQKGTDIDGETAGDQSGWSVSSPDNNTVAIGAIYNSGTGNDAGHVRVYEWNGSGWIQKGSDIDGEDAGDNSGWSVSMPDSNTVAIGARYNNGNGNNAGHVRVYSWNGSAWAQKGADIDGEAAVDWCGRSVSMPDSNTVAVGAPFNDGNGNWSGHVRIYSWNGSTWLQKGADIDGEAAGDQSGSSVSMPDSNTVAVGAMHNSANGTEAGHVRVYEWDGTAWIQKGADIDSEAAGDKSGSAVSMPGNNTLATGAPFNDGSGTSAGHARVYSFTAVSVQENIFENSITVYPIPASGFLNVDLKRFYGNVDVVIRNAMGQEINKHAFGNISMLQLSLPGLAGIYFAELTAGNRKAYLKIISRGN